MSTDHALPEEEEAAAFREVCREVRDGLLEEIASAAFGLDCWSFDTPEAEEAHEALQFAVWLLLKRTNSGSLWFTPEKFKLEDEEPASPLVEADGGAR